jgi:parallel beta-helix repeat protein
VVTNLIWSPCTDASTCQAVATAILVTQSDNVRISGNTAGVTQVGIFVDGNNAVLRGNKAFSAAVFDDIRVEGNGSRVRDNQTTDGGEAGIFISGNNNVIEDNTIAEAPVGILKATGSTGNILSGNVYFNVAVQKVDPPTPSLAGKIQPER